MLELFENVFGKIKYRRQIFRLSDGGQLALDWLIHNKEQTEKRNLVVCIPGLSGDSKELYCIAVAKECLLKNLDFVVINNRGTSNVALTVSN